jgi:TonB-dependent receptor
MRPIFVAYVSIGLLGIPARAQSPAASNSTTSAASDESVVELETYVVQGLTASMQKAQEMKRQSLQIMESIIADDVNKLPDLSVTEALQRITGISITRDLGEGAGVALRGLNEVTSTVNGQEVFSPQVVTGESRVMNLQTIPSEMIAAINVIKTPTADMIEGGIAGTIDIRLRKPLDFDGDLNGYLNARLLNGEAADSTKFQYSGMLTDSWNVGEGKMGVLVNYTRQDRDIRQDLNSNGNPLAFQTPDGPVVGSNGSYENRFFAERTREGASAVVQWAPNEKLRAFVEYSFSEQETLQDSVAPWFTPGTTATNVVLYPGVTVLADHDRSAATPMIQVPVARSMTVIDGAMNSYSIIRDWKEKTDQYTAGATWRNDRLTVEAELSHMKSRSDFDNLGLYATLPNVSYDHDMTGDLPLVLPLTQESVSVDRADEGTFAFWFYNWIVNQADSTAATIDAEYDLGSDKFFRDVKVGARLSQRNANIDRVSISGGAPGNISDYPSLYRRSIFNDFFEKDPGKVTDVLEVDPRPLRGYPSFASLVGANPVLPPPQPQYEFDIDEKTWAAYAMTTFSKREGLRFDGNVGVRVIGTDVTANGMQRLNNVYSPITEKGDYTDVLPSLNTRWYLQDDFFLRLSASKQLSRQSFGRLNPNLRLTPPGTPGQIGTGQAGNAGLPPLRTDQFDAALEKYFSASTNVYVSYYHKKIDGYTQNSTTLEEYDGVQYNVSRPYAVNGAKIQGMEFGYQQFFTFLPGPFGGLGVLANYTWIDAEDPAGLPLTNLSKNGYNIIGMYEKYGFTARIAYNWRDTFARSNSTAAGAIGNVPIYDKAFGWMDISIGYQINENLKISFDVSNALRTRRESYYRDEIFQHEDVLEDRQFLLAATWKL